MASTTVAVFPGPARGAPEGHRVVGGSATIDNSEPGRTIITQKSKRAAINWDSFSLDAGELTKFKQPGRDAVALNRVVGSDVSKINGRLEANGSVWLVNPNGVLFGPNAEIDVHGLVATTADIADRDFLAGRDRFTIPAPAGSVVSNEGSITVGEQGLAALVAPQVRNSGVIQAELAQVTLAAAPTFALDFTGDGLVRFEATSEVVEALLAEAPLVENTGTIRADGGRVLITARAAAGVVDQVISLGGVVEADTVRTQEGEIVLEGGISGEISVEGVVEALGDDPGEPGGAILASGERVEVGPAATIDASGASGGGRVLLGAGVGGAPIPLAKPDVVLAGAEPGQVPIPEPKPAQAVAVAPGATIAADATQQGDGGTIVAWADGTTVFAGSATARGSPEGGDGGLIETSGKLALDVEAASIDASAPKGAPGEWLLDPHSVSIVEELPPRNILIPGLFEITAGSIAQVLNGGTSVTISTDAKPDPELESQGLGGFDLEVFITVDADIIANEIPSSENPRLNLISGGDITLSATISSGSSAGTLDINFDADGEISFVSEGGDFGEININGDATLTASALEQRAPVNAGTYSVDAGTIVLAADTTTAGLQTYNGTVVLDGSRILSSSGGAVTFNGTVDGLPAGSDAPDELNVTASSSVAFNDAVGASAPLTSLEVGAGVIELQDVTTTSDQTYTAGQEVVLSSTFMTDGGDFVVDGPTRLASASTEVDVTTDGDDGDVVFGGSVDGTVAEANNLTLRIGGGTVRFEDDVGTSRPLGVVQIETDGEIGIPTAADVRGDEDTFIPLQIISAGDLDELVVSNLPPGSELTDGVNSFVATEEMTAVDIIDFDLDELRYRPPAQSGDDANLTLQAEGVAALPENIVISQVFDVANLLINGEPVTIEELVIPFRVDVIPVPDTPEVMAGDSEGRDGTLIPLDFFAELVDQDGSESLTVTVAGLPEGTILRVDGVEVEPNADGNFVIKAPDPELSGLAVFPPPGIESAGLEIRFVAQAVEEDDGVATATAMSQLRISPLDDPIMPAGKQERDQPPLPIDPGNVLLTEGAEPPEINLVLNIPVADGDAGILVIRMQREGPVLVDLEPSPELLQTIESFDPAPTLPPAPRGLVRAEGLFSNDGDREAWGVLAAPAVLTSSGDEEDTRR